MIILLPAKNEEEGIGEVIDRIPKEEIRKRGFEPRVVVVDGSSTDSTREIAKSKGAELINQKSKPGKGWGFREAIKTIYEDDIQTNGDLLIMMDADATYSPEDIPRFMDELQHSEVVWGSRMKGKIEEGAMSATNKLGNKILSFAASVLFFKKTSDLCTGYWGFQSESLRRLQLTAKGFNLETEIFGSAVKNRMKTSEIPIDYHHREGHSNLKWYSDGPRIFLTTVKKRFEYQRRPFHDVIFVFSFLVLLYSVL